MMVWTAWERLRPYAQSLADFGLLVIAFFTSFSLAPLIDLPYKNRYNISTTLADTGYNPDNNFYRLIFIIIFTLVFFYVLKYLYTSRFSWVVKAWIILLLLGNFFLVNMIEQPSIYAYHIDNYHAGEQLSPAAAYLHGRSLYDNIFYLRGAGFDAVFPAHGMRVLGATIGSFFITSDIESLLAVLSFLVLLAFLIRNPLRYAAVAFLFYISGAVSLMHVRDVLVWCAFGLTLLAFKTGLRQSVRRVIFGAIGLLCSLELYVSIDRGVLLFILAWLLAAILLLIRADGHNRYAFAPKALKRNAVDSLIVVGGIVIGIGLPGLLLGPASFKAFIKMSFHDIPAYNDLLFAQQFPPLFAHTYLFWAPVFVAIASGFLLIRLYTSEQARKDLNTLAPLTLLYIVSVAFIKVGTNRIAIERIAYGSTALYLVSLMILVVAIRSARAHKAERTRLFPPIALSMLVIAVFSQLNLHSFINMPDYSKKQLLDYGRMRTIGDDYWLNAQTWQTKQYINDHTAQSDYIFSFTADPLYYYLTGRQNPSRFYISWFADPQPYTNELLRDLELHKPKLIVYQEDNWLDAPDNVSMQNRIPEVNNWIVHNYHHRVQLGKTTMLEP